MCASGGREVELGPFLEALERSRPGGRAVRQWSLHVRESRGLSLGIKDREVGNPHGPLRLAESCGARYRIVWDDGLTSRGFAERRLLTRTPAVALENARAAAHDDPDAARVAGPATFPDVELVDPQVARMADGESALWAERLEAVRARVVEHGLRTWSGGFSAGSAEARVLSSSGLDATSRGTSASWSVSFNGELGDGFASRGVEPERDFLARLDRLVELVQCLGQPASSCVQGLLPVLLHPHVVDSYVVGTLLDNLSGETVAHGEGHFRREQFGAREPVLREDLGLRIDPLLRLRSGSYRFTTEGIPAAPCTFIDAGRLIQPVLDIKYARRLGLAPTPLPSESDTLFLEGPQPLSLDQALAAAAGGVLVLSVLGVHTQDRASGDFSLSAPQALAVSEGGLAGRLRGTISGNLFGLLRDPGLCFVTFPGEETPGLLATCRFDPR